MDKHSFIALNRFGLGARFEDLPALIPSPKSWLREQIKAPQSNHSLFQNFTSTQQAMAALADIKKSRDEEKKKQFQKLARQNFSSEMKARFELGLTTDTPFYERLVHFWSNHFTISAKGKPVLFMIAGALEREAIRPHVTGNFVDMLLAVSRHPAMLVYLDNASSIGPNSILGNRKGKGLNENLAREILELHTLGVNGGYTQQDVIALAKIITGWTIDRKGGEGFKFIRAMHEPGEKRLLGKTYDHGGIEEGVQVLKDLAAHPSTAEFLATKLARHFIADEPSRADIQILANAYKRGNGNLIEVYKALIELPSIWKDPLPKIKTPYEMITSTMRLLGLKDVQDDMFKRVMKSLALFQHVPFSAPSPAGWPDTAQAWISSDSLMNRLEWIHTAAQRTPVRSDNLDKLVDYIKPVADPDTLLWILRAPSIKEGMALALSSPALQRR